MKSTIVLLFCFVVSFSALAQNDNDVLFSYGGTPVTVKEFLSVYKKNNLGKDVDFKESSLKDYLNLYENFKIKVAEGKAQKIDTLASLKNELVTYKKQLAKSYLVDKEMLERMYREAYDRSQWDIHAAHIVVKLSPDATSKDTLAAYEKISKIRARIVNGKEDFFAVAKETSEDPSAKTNGGDLGYFTSMQSFYPFETAAFTTPKGGVSYIFRTKIGYHIIKVIDKRATRGQVQVQHILVAVAKSSPATSVAAAKDKANRMLAMIKSGKMTMDDLAKDSSDDRTSAVNNGKLPWFGTGRMVPEFEEAAFSLKNVGDLTSVIKTDYGFHIIKLLAKKMPESYEKSKEDVKKIIDKDARIEEAKKSFVKLTKKEYAYTENKINYAEFVNMQDSSLLKGTYKAPPVMSAAKTLFTMDGKNYTTADFATYLETAQRTVNKKNGLTTADVIDKVFPAWTEKIAMDVAESKLESKHPDFKTWVDEYNDGIVLFEITDRNVWNKAVTDTTGIKTFYKNLPKKYQWNNRVKATIYKCADAAVLDRVRLMEDAKNPASDEDLKKAINTPEQPYNVGIDGGTYEKGQSAIIDECKWEKGFQTVNKDGSMYLVRINELVPPMDKTIEEARGYVIADYQEYLEKTWIASMRAKYPIVEHEDVFKKMVK